MSIDTVVQVFNDKQEYFSDCRIRGGVKAPGKQLRLNIPFFVDSETGEVTVAKYGNVELTFSGTTLISAASGTVVGNTVTIGEATYTYNSDSDVLISNTGTTSEKDFAAGETVYTLRYSDGATSDTTDISTPNSSDIAFFLDSMVASSACALRLSISILFSSIKRFCLISSNSLR